MNAMASRLMESLEMWEDGGGRLFRSWMRAPVLTSALAVVAVACAPAASRRFPAKPPGCALETINALPQRPFIELETFALPSPESMRDVLDIVQERACRGGADAIYAPKAGRGYSYAIALKWNDAPAPVAPPVPAPAVPPAPPAPGAPPPAP
jgi:hypothetical protein